MILQPVIHHWRDFNRADRLAGTASVTMMVLILVALLAPLLPLDPPDQVAAHPRLSEPSADLVFGSYNLGRYVLSRVLHGARLTFLLSGISVLLASVAGVAIGLIAAYSGKALDEIISRFSDIVFSFPAVLMGLLITAIVGPGEFAAICAIILVTLPPIVRVVRAAAMEVTGTDYVTIAWLSGASPARLLLVNVLPNISVPVVTQVAYSISIGMLARPATAGGITWIAAARRQRLHHCRAMAGFWTRHIPRDRDLEHQPDRRRVAGLFRPRPRPLPGGMR